jgi:hypothetical protein
MSSPIAPVVMARDDRAEPRAPAAVPAVVEIREIDRATPADLSQLIWTQLAAVDDRA